MANAPFRWIPSALAAQGTGGDVPGTPIIGGNVGAGDWCQVFVNFRRGNTRLVYLPGYFMIHVVYTPNSDDAQPHEDQAVTYGGAQSGVAGAGANRRRNYHIDPGVAFQVPWDGQLSLVAGGESGETCPCDVLLIRGFTPRDAAAQGRLIQEAQEYAEAAETPDQLQMAQWMMQVANRAPHTWAPPVVGVPQLVPSTWIDIPAPPAAVAIPFPDGAVEMISVGAAGGVTRFTINVMGNALALDTQSGIPTKIGSFSAGLGCTSGTPATWAPGAALTSVTILSSLGG